jgi:hypothetical protein
MQVSDFESEDTLQTILHHLTKDVVKADSLLMREKNPHAENGMIDVKNLRESFQNVPKDISESDVERLEPYVKAFLLFFLGTVIFSNGSRSISPKYLQLVENNKVDHYAWGHVRVSGP